MGRVSVVVAILAATMLASGAAWADRRCVVPLADWQPREALVTKLAGEGWTIVSIRSDDGCYKVVAKNARGETLKSKFDPATLERIAREPHERHERDDHHERDDDH